MARVDFKDMVKFTEEVVKKPRLFSDYELVRLDEYLGMDTAPAWNIKKPMAEGGYECYRVKDSDKIDKICYGELHYMKRAKYCAFNMTATDDYDLPIFACEFDETSKRLSLTVDFMPVVDIAVYPEYRKKYLDPLADLWRTYRSIPGLTEEGRCLVQRRYGPWPWARATMSPYPIDGRVTETEVRNKAVEPIVAYARAWLALLDRAQPVPEGDYKQEMLRRKRTMQKYYRDLDPGGEVLKKLFGEEGHKLFVSLVF